MKYQALFLTEVSHRRGLSYLVIVVIAIILAMGWAACGGTDATREVDPSDGAQSRTATTGTKDTGVSLDRIAYVNATGDLFTIDPDGRSLRILTGGVQASTGSAGRVMAQPLNLNNYYAWPTWSPDGSKLAVSQVRVSGRDSKISVEIIDTNTGTPKTTYENQTGGMIAQGAPHYLYWSPDSRYLAFIASTAEGLTLFVDDTDNEGAPVAVETGAPLYLHWSSDSASLLIHSAAEIKLAEKPFTSSPRLLLTSMSPFRVPAISPDGERFAYIQTTDTGAGFFVASVGAPDAGTKLLDVGELAALAWSPDGKSVAVADQEDSRSAVFQRLRVIPIDDGSNVQTIHEESFLSFFWSPLGDRIAWVTLDMESRSFVWMVSDSSGGEVKSLFTYQPSADAFTMLTFFDQYAYSNSPWSPDGSQLVVAGTLEGSSGRRNGETPTGDRIFVVNVSDGKPPLDIAGGILAFWSWN